MSNFDLILSDGYKEHKVPKESTPDSSLREDFGDEISINALSLSAPKRNIVHTSVNTDFEDENLTVSNESSFERDQNRSSDLSYQPVYDTTSSEDINIKPTAEEIKLEEDTLSLEKTVPLEKPITVIEEEIEEPSSMVEELESNDINNILAIHAPDMLKETPKPDPLPTLSQTVYIHPPTFSQKVKMAKFPLKVPKYNVNELEKQAMSVQNTFRVLKYLPLGVVPNNLKTIKVTFSHPLGTDLDALPITPTITPQPPSGLWKLQSDFKTVMYTVEDGLFWPCSTQFTVTIPNTHKEFKLEKPFTFDFNTNRLQLINYFPRYTQDNRSYPTDAPVLLIFDQKVETSSLLKNVVSLKTGTKTYDSIRRVEKPELLAYGEAKGIPNYKSLVDALDEDFWFAFASVKPIVQGHASMSLHVAPGIRSQSGPLATLKSYNIDFPLVMPFAISRVYLYRSLEITFSNPIVKENQTIADLSWRPQVQPALPEGAWSMKGTQTLLYTPLTDVSWPGSTEFVITFDTKLVTNINNEPLYKGDASDKHYNVRKIETARNHVVRTYKNHGTCEPIIVVCFNQRISRREVAQYFRFEKSKNVLASVLNKIRGVHNTVQAISAEEADMDEHEISFLDSLYEFRRIYAGRYVLLKPEEPLDPDSKYNIVADTLSSSEGRLLAKINFSMLITTPPEMHITYFERKKDIHGKSVSVTFNEPVVHEFLVPIPLLRQPTFKPLPPKGTWMVISTHTIQYTPSEAWKKSTEYEVSFKRFKNFKGVGVNLEDKSSFNTSTNKLVKCLSKDYNDTVASIPKENGLIYLEFSQPVDASTMIKNISFKDGEKKTSALLVKDASGAFPQLNEGNRDHVMVVSPKKPMLPNTLVTLSILRITSTLGPLTNEEETLRQIKILHDFTVTQCDLEDDLVVRFSQPIVKTIHDPIPVTPSATPDLPQGQWQVGEDLQSLKYTPISEWPYLSKYTIRVDPFSSILGVPLEKKFTGTVQNTVRVWPPKYATIHSNSFLIVDAEDVDVNFVSENSIVYVNGKKSSVKLNAIKPSSIKDKALSKMVRTHSNETSSIFQFDGTLEPFSDIDITFQLTPTDNFYLRYKTADRFDCNVIYPVIGARENIDSTITFHIAFTHPIQETTDFEKSIELKEIGTKTPISVPWHFKDIKTVMSTESVALKPSTKYKLTISGTIVNLEGEQMKEKELTFVTKCNQLIEAFPPLIGTNLYKDSYPIFLRFSQPVDPLKIVEQIKFYTLKKTYLFFGSEKKQIYCGVTVVDIKDLEDCPHEIKSLLKLHKDKLDHVVVIRPKLPLSKSYCFVKIGPNITSQLGECTSARRYKVHLDIVGDFTVESNASKDRITFRFSHYMLPATYDTSINAYPMLRPKVSPRVPSYYQPQWKWLDRKTLQFTNKVNSDLTFLFTFPRGMKSYFNEPLSKDYVFKMEGKPFAITNYRYQITYSKPKLKVSFSHYVDPYEVEKHMFLAQGKTHLSNLQYEPSRSTKHDDGTCFTFRALNTLPANSRIDLVSNPTFCVKYGHEIGTRTVLCQYKTSPQFKLKKMDMTTNKIMITFSDICHRQQNFWNLLKITPPVCIDRIEHMRYTLTIHYQPYTFNDKIEYKIQVSGDLKDTSGNSLGSDASFGKVYKFQVEPSTFSTLLSTSHRKSTYVYDPALLQDHLKKGSVPYHILVKNYKNLRVVLYKLNPLKDWIKWQDHFANNFVLPAHHDGDVFKEIGEKVYDEEIEITSFVTNQSFLFPIDLKVALSKEGLGHVGVLIVPTLKSHYPNNINRPIVATWVQCSNISLETLSTVKETHCWVNDLKTGSPVTNSEIYSISNVKAKKVGVAENGTLQFHSEKAFTLIATSEKDSIVVSLPARKSKEMPEEQYVFHVFDDRAIYKEDEEAHFKGYIRNWTFNKTLNQYEYHSLKEGVIFQYELIDALGSKMLDGEVSLSSLSSFGFNVKIPLNSCLGTASLRIYNDKLNISYTHNIEIQDFRTPQIKTDIVLVDIEPRLYNSIAMLKSTSTYFNGGAIADCPVKWTVATQSGSYAPPKWLGYSFNMVPVPNIRPMKSKFQQYKELALRTNDEGSSQLRIQFTGKPRDPPMPVSVVVGSETTDLDSQVARAEKIFIVHPSSRYVGIKFDRFKRTGPAYANIVVVSIDGASIPNVPIEISIHGHRISNFLQKDTKELAKMELFSEIKPINLSLDRDDYKEDENPYYDSYTISASVLDESNLYNEVNVVVEDPFARVVKTKAIYNGQMVHVFNDPLHEENASIHVQKTVVFINDTASIDIKSPILEGRGILRVRNFTTLIHEQVFEVKEGESHVEFTVNAVFFPTVELAVEIVGLSNGKIGLARGVADLIIQASDHIIPLSVKPLDPMVQPGSETSIRVEIEASVRDKYVNTPCEVALLVIDEAILSLSGHTLQNPLKTFFSSSKLKAFFENTYMASSRSQITYETIVPIPEKPPVKPQLSRQSLAQPSRPSLAEPKKLRLETTLKKKSKAGNRRARSVKKQDVDEKRFKMKECDMAPKVDYAFSISSENEFEEDSDEDDADEDIPFEIEPEDETFKGNVEAEVETPKPLIRSNFNPVAHFDPMISLGPEGFTDVPIKLPDNLTRYRIWAIAVAGDTGFGMSESTLTASLPLQVRVMAPSHMNLRDECSFPVVIQSKQEISMDVQVAVAVQGANIQGSQAVGYKITLEPMKRKVLFVPLTTDKVGKVTIRVLAQFGHFADCQDVTMNVLLPPTTDGFCKSGTLTGKSDLSLIQLNKPQDCLEEFGKFSVTLSSSQIQYLVEPLNSVYSWDMELIDHYASKLIAFGSSYDLVDAVKSIQFTKEQLLAQMKSLMKFLSKCQQKSGGFNFWGSHYLPVNYYVTAHVAHGIAVSKDKFWEFWTPGWRKDLESCLKSSLKINLSLPVKVYVIYALVKLTGTGSYVHILETILEDTTLDHISLETLAMMLTVLTGKFSKEKASTWVPKLLNYFVVKLAALESDNSPYSEEILLTILFSSVRQNAVILEALCYAHAENDTIQHIFQNLVRSRVNGKWGTTQENCWGLLALSCYYKHFEAKKPDFQCFLWVNSQFSQTLEFKNREDNAITSYTFEQLKLLKLATVPSGEVKSIEFDENEIENDVDDEEVSEDHGGDQVLLLKKGSGTLYYNMNIQFTPSSLAINEKTDHFVLTRSYFSEESQKVIPIQRSDAGVYFFKKDTTIVIKIQLIVMSDKNYVSIRDALPGGFEPLMNQKMELHWVSHVNFRRKGAEVYAERIKTGSYEFTYKVRAILAGRFLIPPTYAEEMYTPDVTGRTSTSVAFIQ